jgi:hypothetical protein
VISTELTEFQHGLQLIDRYRREILSRFEELHERDNLHGDPDNPDAPPWLRAAGRYWTQALLRAVQAECLADSESRFEFTALDDLHGPARSAIDAEALDRALELLHEAVGYMRRAQALLDSPRRFNAADDDSAVIDHRAQQAFKHQLSSLRLVGLRAIRPRPRPRARESAPRRRRTASAIGARAPPDDDPELPPHARRAA